MSTFEPTVVLAILKNSSSILAKERKEFENKWKAAVSSFLISDLNLDRV
jgi:hypothetical protein